MDNVMLVSDIHHSGSVIYVHVCVLFLVLFPFRLLQNIGWSFPVPYSRSLLVIYFNYY